MSTPDSELLSTPLIADACVRLGLPLRSAPPGIAPVLPATGVAGRVLPTRHLGSVDVFLEAIERADPGDVLVIDDGGRKAPACVGDLVALEAQAAGLAGIVVWGVHRDTSQLREIGLPVFSYGAFSAGPLEAIEPEGDPLSDARLGDAVVTRQDYVFADDDGVVFVPVDRVAEIVSEAERIARTERDQARAVREGRTLRTQLRFDDYLARREQDPAYTFRRHLREIGGAVEE